MWKSIFGPVCITWWHHCCHYTVWPPCHVGQRLERLEVDNQILSLSNISVVSNIAPQYLSNSLIWNHYLQFVTPVKFNDVALWEHRKRNDWTWNRTMEDATWKMKVGNMNNLPIQPGCEWWNLLSEAALRNKSKLRLLKGDDLSPELFFNKKI